MKHLRKIATPILVASMWACAVSSANAITCNKTSELMSGGDSSPTFSSYRDEVPMYVDIELSKSKTIQFGEPVFDGLMNNGKRDQNYELANCGIRFRIPVTIVKTGVTKIKNGFFEYKHNVELSKERGKPCWKFKDEDLSGVNVAKYLPEDFCRVR